MRKKQRGMNDGLPPNNGFRSQSGLLERTADGKLAVSPPTISTILDTEFGFIRQNTNPYDLELIGLTTRAMYTRSCDVEFRKEVIEEIKKKLRELIRKGDADAQTVLLRTFSYD